jgi:hypothetical protein
MASLEDIRAGIARNLTDRLDLAPLTGVQISPYMLGSPTLPTVYVMGPDLVTYHRAMSDGLTDWTIIVQAFVTLTSDIGGQRVLDRMLDTSGAASVKAAIEYDKTLGGACQNLQVRSTTGYQQYALASVQGDVLGAQWNVQVLT